MKLECLSPAEIQGDVYIVPCSCVGIAVYHLLKRNGVNVIGFCDNSVDENNVDYLEKIYDSIPVTNPVKACTKNPDATYIISTPKYRGDIYSQLKELGAENILDAGQILTEDNFLEAINDMDEESAKEVTGVPNPKSNASWFIPHYWLSSCGLNNILAQDLFFHIEVHEIDKVYNAFKKFIESSKKDSALNNVDLFGIVTLCVDLEGDLPAKADIITKIIEYAKEFIIPTRAFTLRLGSKIINKRNFDLFNKLMGERNISTNILQDISLIMLNDIPYKPLALPGRKYAPVFSYFEEYSSEPVTLPRQIFKHEYIDLSRINGDIYITPCTCMGITVYHILRKRGIAVAGFCDDAENYKRKNYDGIPIIATSDTCAANPDATYIIAAPNRGDIYKQLKNMGAINIVDASQIITRDTFLDAINSMDDVCINTFLNVLDSKAEAHDLASCYWLLPSEFDNILFKNIIFPLGMYNFDKAYEAFKHFYDSNKKDNQILCEIMVCIDLGTSITSNATAIKQIIRYIKNSSVPTAAFFITMFYSRQNINNFNLFNKILEEYGIKTIAIRDNNSKSILHIEDSELPIFVSIPYAYSDASNHYQGLFIHIVKNAGNSLNNYLHLPGFLKHDHHTTAVDCKYEDEEKFRRYFKFAIVRNPWDWFVSYYFFHQRVASEMKWNINDMHNVFLKNKTLKGVIMDLRKISNVPSQYSWICDKEENILVDYIGRFENLEETFRYIGNKIGVDPRKPISHLNATKHKHYTEYYDEETKEIIAKVFKKDIELFGYEFDKHPGPNIIINSREDFVPVNSRNNLK